MSRCYLDVLFLVLHAPQRGRDLEERKLWWAKTADIVQQFFHFAPLFVLGDMNATTGPADDDVTSQYGVSDKLCGRSLYGTPSHHHSSLGCSQHLDQP